MPLLCANLWHATVGQSALALFGPISLIKNTQSICQNVREMYYLFENLKIVFQLTWNTLEDHAALALGVRENIYEFSIF